MGTREKKMPLTVIGIDPGSVNLGWGVVCETSGVVKFVECGVIRPKGKDFSARMGNLFLELSRVIEHFQPDEAAVETVFTHKNIMSALKLGQARGVVLAACAAQGISVADYEPTAIKKALVGVGRADKSQVSFMVGRLLGVKEDWAVDAGDALGCAICHLNTRRLTALTQRAK